MPCEILWRAVDGDARVGGFEWQKGDPVIVRPDGHPWGSREGPPNFVITRVTDGDEATYQARLRGGRRTRERGDERLAAAFIETIAVLPRGRTSVSAATLEAEIIVRERPR